LQYLLNNFISSILANIHKSEKICVSFQSIIQTLKPTFYSNSDCKIQITEAAGRTCIAIYQTRLVQWGNIRHSPSLNWMLVRVHPLPSLKLFPFLPPSPFFPLPLPSFFPFSFFLLLTSPKMRVISTYFSNKRLFLAVYLSFDKYRHTDNTQTCVHTSYNPS
jgi:hypothetical protein